MNELPVILGQRRTPTVVLTGIAGRFGRMLARDLRQDHRVIGVDPRGARHLPQDITVHAVDLRRKKAEDIFRRNRVDTVIHMNPTPGWSGGGREHRNLTIMGTRRILEYCQKYRVSKLVLVSSATLYGAHPDNNQFLSEDSPLLGGFGFSAMRDLVEADIYGTSFFWRHPEIDTVVLRPTHIVGRLGNTASTYLAQRIAPTLLGFDPMMQIMSPEDFIHAIRLAMKPGIRGIFNIAGDDPAPLSELIRLSGNQALPVPEIVAKSMLGTAFGLGLAGIPAAQLDYLKYVCMAEDSHAREVLRYSPKMTLADTLKGVR